MADILTYSYQGTFDKTVIVKFECSTVKGTLKSGIVIVRMMCLILLNVEIETGFVAVLPPQHKIWVIYSIILYKGTLQCPELVVHMGCCYWVWEQDVQFRVPMESRRDVDKVKEALDLDGT